jgi:hypothetical protein
MQSVAPLCGRCHAKKAHYGFGDGDGVERSATLCFDCFRIEIAPRRESADRPTRR